MKKLLLLGLLAVTAISLAYDWGQVGREVSRQAPALTAAAQRKVAELQDTARNKAEIIAAKTSALTQAQTSNNQNLIQSLRKEIEKAQEQLNNVKDQMRRLGVEPSSFGWSRKS